MLMASASRLSRRLSFYVSTVSSSETRRREVTISLDVVEVIKETFAE